MNALAQWIRHENIVTERAFHDKKKWQLFKEIFTKTSVEGFVAATKALHTMSEDVTTSLISTECKLFGIVGSEDDVFKKLMNEMKKEIPRFEFKVIEQSDHWMIVENPVALDEALDVLLNNIKYR
jgi:pimeloyl-ACP methyl ester carboxylesterase